MGLGICSSAYVGRPDMQLKFRYFFGGNPYELPIDIRRRLDAQKNDRKRRIKKRKNRQY